MKYFQALIIFILLLLSGLSNSVVAESYTKQDLVITPNSIGIVKIGIPLKDIEKKAKDIGLSVKRTDAGYVLFDKSKMPLLTFNVFSSKSKSQPVRCIKTTSSLFVLPSGLSLINTPIADLEAEYSKASIFRIKPRKDSPEFIDFKNWPFSESIVEGSYILKYQAQLNKLIDEYGKIIPVGKYENDFCLYADDYQLEARIESFQIEALEPKVKFKNPQNQP